MDENLYPTEENFYQKLMNKFKSCEEFFSLNVEMPSKESTSLYKVTWKIPRALIQCCHV